MRAFVKKAGNNNPLYHHVLTIMTPQELENYLHTHIPLTQAMQVSVLKADEASLVLQAPLAPNINPHKTVFGGSVAAIATLSAWCLVYTQLERAGVKNSLVIRRSALEYERAIVGEFTATAQFVDAAQWQVFIPSFNEKGKARIEVESLLEYNGQVAVRFKGEFVALKA
jgi:thioesterase domain-containing protein